jgi:hypothetical protein
MAGRILPVPSSIIGKEADTPDDGTTNKTPLKAQPTPFPLLSIGSLSTIYSTWGRSLLQCCFIQSVIHREVLYRPSPLSKRPSSPETIAAPVFPSLFHTLNRKRSAAITAPRPYTAAVTVNVYPISEKQIVVICAIRIYRSFLITILGFVRWIGDNTVRKFDCAA